MRAESGHSGAAGQRVSTSASLHTARRAESKTPPRQANWAKQAASRIPFLSTPTTPFRDDLVRIRDEIEADWIEENAERIALDLEGLG